MKLGFDIHGVIDTFGVFQSLINKLLRDNEIEVHVISGLSRSEADEQIGHLIDLNRITSYFSIADYLESRDDVEVTWINGMPWADETAWNKAKADYCDEVGIDIMFDDSQSYVETFHNIKTIYCQIHNRDRIQYFDKKVK